MNWDKIVVGDCIEQLKALPDGCVDLVFADPPYNLQLGGNLSRPDESHVDAVDDAWDSFPSFAAYDEFTHAWLREIRRVLKPSGCLWTIGSYHNVFRLGTAVQDLGFWILNDIVWVKTNPMPNFRGTRFTNAHETLIWAKRSKDSKYRFNYEAMKAGNDDLQMRSDWMMPICGGDERLRDDTGEKVHPTQKPEEMIARILLANTAPGDVVLDPFSGSGTTCAVAKRFGRHYLGIERDPTYAAASKARIAAVDVLPADSVSLPASRRTAPKIPFRVLVERGFVSPGSVLVDKQRRHEAVVRADGSLQMASGIASIHKGAADVMGRQSMNGWDFWHMIKDEILVPIETFRQQVRLEMPAS